MNTERGEAVETERWTACQTPYGWFSCIKPCEWVPGIHPTEITPEQLENSIEVLNMVIPLGGCTFYFATDKTADGNPQADWVDAVTVSVQ